MDAEARGVGYCEFDLVHSPRGIGSGGSSSFTQSFTPVYRASGFLDVRRGRAKRVSKHVDTLDSPRAMSVPLSLLGSKA